MVRMMPQEEIGVWVLFTSVTAILETLRNGFIRNPFITHLVSAEEGEKKSIVSASLGLHCVLAAAVIVFLLALGLPLSRFWNAQNLDILFYVYALNSVVLVPFLHFEYLQQAQVQFKGIFASNFVKLGFLSAYVIGCYIIGYRPSLVELGIVQLIGTVVACFVSYPFVKQLYLFGRDFNKALLSKLFHFGKFTLGTTISSMVMRSTDTWMIGRMISTVGVALYNPALRISNIVEVPTLAVANMVFPQVSQKMKERGVEGIRDVYVKSVSLILALMLPMVLPIYFLSDFLIETIFGKDYMAAAPILRVTVFYTLIIPFNRQFGTIMDGLKTPKLNFYLLVMAAVLNIIFNYFFLKAWGTIGAAYGTLLSYLIVLLLNQIILYRKFGINTFKVFPTIFEWYVVGWDFFWRRIVKLA
jgi:O-antigen/teichoic acid export membrane protein